MSLPSGYKLLEYIRSSGKQYIDTGLYYGISNYTNFRIIADSIIGTASNGWAVSGVGSLTCFYYGCGNNSRVIYYGNGNSDVSTGVTYTEKRSIFDLSHQSRTFKVTEVESGNVLLNLNISLGTPNHNSKSIYLFAYKNSSDNSAYCHIETLYACKIYNNETLVRNYIPCQNNAGEVGLWDDVNSKFYGNAGTGTFTAGPIVIPIPSTPLNFILSSSTDTTVTLSWDAVEDATGYKLYRNGNLVTILFSTSYTDTIEPFTDYVYTLTAYNENGESNPATLDVFVIIPPVQPKYFNFIGANNSSIWLSWQPVNHADTYKLYRDGTLLHETRDTKYTDTELNINTQYNYTLVASNSSGYSPKSSILKASTISLDLVYDRTQEDGNKIAQYIQAKFSNLSEEQQAEWLSYHSKGGWNYTDLNRIEYWIGYITELLGLYIESLDDIPKLEASWDKRSNLYVEDVTHIQEVLELLKTKFKLTEFNWETMQRGPNWDYKQANAIERNLKTLYEQFYYMYIWPICGDATCGGDYL